MCYKVYAILLSTCYGKITVKHRQGGNLDMLSRLLTTREQIILSGLAISILLGAVTLFYIEKQKQNDHAFVPATFTSEQAGVDTDAAVKVASVAEAAEVMAVHENTTQQASEVTTAMMSQETRTAVSPNEHDVEKIGVAVMGAVRKPGFYWMPPVSRVDDLINVSGGLTDQADLRDINPAAWIIDGTTLTIPVAPQREVDSGVMRLRRTEGKVPLNPAAYTMSGAGVDTLASVIQESQNQVNSPVNSPIVQPVSVERSSSAGVNQPGYVAINRATQAELETLPGIGPALAGRIIQFRNQRPFQTVEDLLQVSGIGPQRFEAIRDQVTLY